MAAKKGSTATKKCDHRVLPSFDHKRGKKTWTCEACGQSWVSRPKNASIVMDVQKPVPKYGKGLKKPLPTSKKKPAAKAKAKATPKAKPEEKAGKATRAHPQDITSKRKPKRKPEEKADKGKPDLLAEAREILPRLQEGTTTLGAERDRLGLKSNKKLREALIEVAGGRQAYKQLMHHSMAHRPADQRIGQKSLEPGDWKPDDSDVPIIESTKYKDGWKSETLTVHLHTKDVIVAPDGTKYVEASSREKADLIVDHSNSKIPVLGKVRYRLYETSSTAKKVKQEEKANTEMEKVTKAKKVVRKQKRVTRKKKAR